MNKLIKQLSNLLGPILILATLWSLSATVLPRQAVGEEVAHRFNLFYSGNLIGEVGPCG